MMDMETKNVLLLLATIFVTLISAGILAYNIDYWSALLFGSEFDIQQAKEKKEKRKSN